MYHTKFLFLVLLLTLVNSISGQIGRPGRCPEFHPVVNFNPQRFMGTWYYITGLENNLYEQGQKCNGWTFDGDRNEINRMQYRSIVERTGGSAQFNALVRTIGNPGNFQLTTSTMEIPTATNFTIIATDYEHWAVQVACQNLGSAHLEFAWVMARSRHPDAQYVRQAEQYLTQNTDIPVNNFQPENQENCPSA